MNVDSRTKELVGFDVEDIEGINQFLSTLENDLESEFNTSNFLMENEIEGYIIMQNKLSSLKNEVVKKDEMVTASKLGNCIDIITALVSEI